MSFNRRSFLQKVGTLVGAMSMQSYLTAANIKSLEVATERVAKMTAEECARDEDYWYQIQQAFTVSPLLINLNNGAVSPQPRVVQEAQEHYNRLINEGPSHYKRVVGFTKEALRGELARIGGCDLSEVAINRNASEGLETIIFGLRLEKGDEVVLSRQDYSNVISAWKQREHRDGIVLKWVDFNIPSSDNDYLVKQFTDAFTAKTKVVNITHMINWTGQILPVKRIADVAKQRDIEVLVDGAHSFAQLQFKISDLNCDYFATSLHKWLCAPFGTGMLYVRKEKIKELYPLFAAPDPEGETINKFEHLGTRSLAVEQAIGQAINFHEYIGAERKEKRLFYLKNYWAEKADQIPRVNILTSLERGYSGAICLISVDGLTPQELVHAFMHPYRIHAGAIKLEHIQGVRITPNVFTLTKDLDRSLAALKHAVETK